MRRILFYSWQSDLPNATNRGFIQRALEDAAAQIAADDTVAVEPVVDRDTQGVPGSPDIAATIFGKIAGADIFVADVSIVTRADGQRAVPNPNVMIELGYAMRALGPERIILVFNTAHGGIEELPFDLRTRRVFVYEMPEDAEQRAPERRKLQAMFEGAICSAIEAIPEEVEVDAVNPAVAAIETVSPSRRIAIRRALSEIEQSLVSIEPKKARDGGTVEDLIDAIAQTQPQVAEFSKISEMIAVMDDEDSALELYRWFGKIFDRFDNPPGFSGRSNTADHDFFKFLGHELFITFVAFLIREHRWQLLGRVIAEPIPMQNMNHQAGSATWEYANTHSDFLLDEGKRCNRITLQGDILSERHSDDGGLANILPMEDLMAADFFLFLLSRTMKDETGFDFRFWKAWSCVYLKQPPRFVGESAFKKTAEQIAGALGLNIDDFKVILQERGPELCKLFNSGWWDYPIDEESIKQIATR